MPSLQEKGKDIGEFNPDFLFIVASYLFSVVQAWFESFDTKVRRVLPNFCPHLLKRLTCLVPNSGYHALLY